MESNTAIVVLTAALVVANIALVVVTRNYARATNRMVEEMKAARGVQVLPRVVPTIARLHAGHALLRVTNVGPGPALDAHLEILQEPNGPSREWSSPLIAPQEVHDFFPTPPDGNPDRNFLHLDAITEVYERFRIRGSFRDVLGQLHRFDEAVDLREHWRLGKAADHAMPDDWPKESARRLEGIEKNLKAMADLLKREQRRRAEEERPE